MKSFTAVLVAGFAALAQAVQLTNSDFSVKAGEPFTITWSGAQGPVTLTLKNGPSNDLKTVSAITTGASGTSFTWTPSASLPADTYAIEITDGSDTNYSNQFPIVGASGTAVASGSASASASASAAASSASSAAASITSAATTSAASETASVTAAANSTTVGSTVTTSTRASTRVSSTTGGSTTAPTTVPGGDAGRIGSPIALIGLTIAAMLYFQ